MLDEADCSAIHIASSVCRLIAQFKGGFLNEIFLQAAQREGGGGGLFIVRTPRVRPRAILKTVLVNHNDQVEECA